MSVDACPECGSSQVYPRATMTPPWRCSDCGHEFEEPHERERKSSKRDHPGGEDSPLYIPDEELLDDLRRVAEQIGETPTLAQYRERGEYSGVTQRTRFGGWGKAIDAAGLERRGRWVTEGAIIEDIQRVADELGRAPRIEDYDEHGERHHSSAERRFGSWTAAVEAAGLEPYRKPTSTGLEELDPEDLGLSPIGERA